ncbi:MAG TPA: DUF2007 domain-containing protein [Terriglobales bacterium]|nr:DUF2007 domain-containing protein [Terriglobales bacterium]
MPIDTERERQRLAALYAGMSEEELKAVAHDAGSLTEVALQTLSDEVRRRGLDIPLAESVVPMTDVEQLQLVVVQQFRDMPQAILAKGTLESAGIECFLVDDNMVRLDWFISNLLGGVKLAVRTEDAEAAREVLEQPIPEGFAVEGVGDYEQPRCPRCGSLEITHEANLDKRIALPALYVGLPIPVPRNVWKCESCGAHWREDGEEGGETPGAAPAHD